MVVGQFEIHRVCDETAWSLRIGREHQYACEIDSRSGDRRETHQEEFPMLPNAGMCVKPLLRPSGGKRLRRRLRGRVTNLVCLQDKCRLALLQQFLMSRKGLAPPDVLVRSCDYSRSGRYNRPLVWITTTTIGQTSFGIQARAIDHCSA